LKLIGTSSIDWAQLSRFYLKTETETSMRNVVLKYKQDGVLDENRTMDNVQKYICIEEGLISDILDDY
jgi:hypothetical protein